MEACHLPYCNQYRSAECAASVLYVGSPTFYSASVRLAVEHRWPCHRPWLWSGEARHWHRVFGACPTFCPHPSSGLAANFAGQCGFPTCRSSCLRLALCCRELHLCAVASVGRTLFDKFLLLNIYFIIDQGAGRLFIKVYKM